MIVDPIVLLKSDHKFVLFVIKPNPKRESSRALAAIGCHCLPKRIGPNLFVAGLALGTSSQWHYTL
jgi:hypothetical protein